MRHAGSALEAVWALITPVWGSGGEVSSKGTCWWETGRKRESDDTREGKKKGEERT